MPARSNSGLTSAAAPAHFHSHDAMWSGRRFITTNGAVAWSGSIVFDGRMGTKSRESIYGASVRAAAEQAADARKRADRLACEAWNKRMLGFQGPARPSPALGDALNAGYSYLEVKCLGCNTQQTFALNSVRRPERRQFTNWSATRAARNARNFRGGRSSAVIWWRCGRLRFQPMIRHQRGGRGNGESEAGK